MDWSGHALLGLRAAEGLPDREINQLKTALYPAGGQRPFMLEIRNMRAKLGAYCLIPDWIYQKGFERHARMPNGKWLPHTPVNSEFSACGGSGISFSANVALLSDLLESLIQELRAGHWEEAVCRAGVLGHFIQEPFTPGHAFDNRLFQELFPDPDPGRSIKLHEAFDCAGGAFPPPEPILLGVSVPEAANRLFAEMFRGMKRGYRYIEPVVRSVYRGDSQEVRRALLMPQSELAARATASAWHTAFCIASGRFDPEEAAHLDRLDLNVIPPYDCHLNVLDHPVADCITGTDGRKHPLTVYDESGTGEKTFSRGFALYGHAGIKYYLNGVYARFRCRLGMPSRMLRGQDEHAHLDFSIETDDRENTVYSEDIRYNGKRIHAEDIRSGMPLKTIDVDIRGAGTLILSSRAEPWTDENGETRFSVPDLILAEPELLK